tara:strand:- start:28222 stop:29169 length:948 start_codon:yes stop_codon:yes gene_type:complete
MDYLQIYKNQFKTTWEHIKSQTIADLKTAKKNKRNFNKLFNNITTELYNEQKKIVTQFTEENLKVCYELFENRHREYDSNLERYEVISLILGNEVKEEYLRLGKSDYEEFVKKIATQQSIDRIQNHFNNYRPYYELIYLQNKYEYFYAKDFKNGSYETSKEYLEMLDIQYPDRKSEPSLFNLIETESNKKSTENIKDPDTVITTRERLSSEFDVNERAVLFHLLKNRLKLGMLDSTELMKLVLIIGATNKFEIFDVKNASKSYFYKKALKGYTVFTRNDQQKKVASLKTKLENNGLKSIAEELSTDYGDFFKKLK